MDLMQENPNEENKVKSLKTSLIIIIAFALVLIIIAVIIYVYSLRVADEQFKVRVDGTSSTDFLKKEDAFIIEDNKVYVSIRDVIPELGYEVQNGEYKQYTEDLSSCYAKNKNQLEIVSFKAGSKEIKKYSAPFENSEYKSFELDDSISDRGGKLYINSADLSKALGITAEYDKANNTLDFTTLPYLSKLYGDMFSNAYLVKSEDDAGSSELTDMMFFNNQKALLTKYVVTRNPDTKQLGVSRYENNSLVETITQRYKTVEFVEGADDFIVKTDDNKYGIISSNGITKIKPEFDEIEEIDKNLGLYLYTQNGKKGVINQNGKTIVYPDYDQIGLDTDFVDLNVKNRFLLFDKCIPVRVDKKWGLVDINGQKIVQTQYDGLGCKLPSSDPNTTGIVIIPELEGIVVEKDEKVGDSNVKKYGVIDLKGEIIVNIVAEEAYAVTIESKTTYYLSFQNQQIDIVSYWRERNNNNANTNTVDEDSQNENQVQQQNETQEQNQQQTQGQTQQNQQQTQNQTQQISEEERNRIIQDIYSRLTDQQKQTLQQMNEEDRQKAIQEYYDTYMQNSP